MSAVADARGAQRAASNVRAALRALFAPEARLLSVGARHVGHAQALEVPSLQALPAASELFDAAVWCPDTELVSGLKQLRAYLRPGARLALWVEPAGLMTQVWSAVRRAPARTKLPLEQACEALLLVGLIAPRLIAMGSLGFAVSASLPAAPDALDAFFAQPSV